MISTAFVLRTPKIPTNRCAARAVDEFIQRLVKLILMGLGKHENRAECLREGTWWIMHVSWSRHGRS